MNKRTLCAAIALILLLGVFSVCGILSGQAPDEPRPTASYRDISGVTGDEINAIEALREQTDYFIYGMLPSTELFDDLQNGEMSGYSALFCRWLTELFGIEFRPALYEWGDLLAGLESGEIDFSGELTPSEERHKKYFMTEEAIAVRTVKSFRLDNSLPLDEIEASRPVRYIFLGGTTTIADTTSVLQGEYEVITVYDYDAAYEKLKSGEGDIFIAEDNVEAAFDIYGDVTAAVFLPLIYSPVSLTTQNQKLAPVIAVAQKALLDDSTRHLTELHKLGYNEYLKHKLFMRFSEEERAYIADHPVVPFAAEYENYPMSFYNKREEEWQGIVFDVLHEIGELTGLSFALANNESAEWPELLSMLDNGEVSLVSELIRTPEREGRYLWPSTVLLSDNYALISKAEFPNITINEILYMNVGIPRNTAYHEVFETWFPNHKHTVFFEGSDIAFDALAGDEIDMTMSSMYKLLALTNFREETGYKANIVFDRFVESTLGFNINETVLCSIIDKAMEMIDTQGIADQWTRKTYDYRIKLARSQLPWVIGTTALLAILLLLGVFSFILSHRNRNESMRLNKLVQMRTAELELETATLRSLFDSLPDFVFCKDLNLKYTRCNKKMEDYFGVSEADLIGKDDAEGLGAPAEMVRMCNESDRILLRDGKLTVMEEFVPGADGTMLLCETVKVPIFSGDAIIGLLGVSRDITERKKLDDELKDALHNATAASRAKSDFLANMSHEIRTPMNAIIGMTSIAEASNDVDRKDYAIGKIKDASIHLLGIINDVLDISKIEANKFELSPVSFDFERMLQKVVNVINFRIDEKNQRFHVNIDNAIPCALIGDDQRLAQVLTNLLSNAVKFTPLEGTITLDAGLVSEAEGVCRLQISVTDNGIGISEGQRERVFQAFEQAESSTARKYGGTGLGLPITKRIVEMMGGDIWVESEPGRGSKFTFTVALRKDDDLRNPQPVENVNWGDLRILTVDDEPETREFFIDMSLSLGIICEVAASGEEALGILDRENNYNIFFLDWKLPGINGIELAQRIRERSTLKPVIILFSSADWSTIKDEAFAAGVSRFLQKPLFRSDIVDVINEYAGVGRVEKNTGQEKQTDDFSAYTILLAEDVEINREIVIALLESTRLNVDCAENGAQALQMFEAAPNKYSMIFMDVQMPEMDGYEATRLIRAMDAPGAKDVPIVAMTANVFREDVEKCISAGMNDHVGKPLDIDDVLDKLRRYLQ